MHDPLVVAFDIKLPWPRRTSWPPRKDRSWHLATRRRPAPGSPLEAETIATGRDPFPWWRPRGWDWDVTISGHHYRFPTLVTIWHAEPNGHDSGEICKHFDRVQDGNGRWQYKIRHGWRWHIHHWRLQVHALQTLRRRLLTRCEWCGGPSRRRDVVNCSHQWDSPRVSWWKGEPGLFHADCSSIASAHATCVCDEPICANTSPEYGPYGRCARCGKSRSFGRGEGVTERLQLLAAIPKGQRDRAVYERVTAMVQAQQDRDAEKA